MERIIINDQFNMTGPIISYNVTDVFFNDKTSITPYDTHEIIDHNIISVSYIEYIGIAVGGFCFIIIVITMLIIVIKKRSDNKNSNIKMTERNDNKYTRKRTSTFNLTDIDVADKDNK